MPFKACLNMLETSYSEFHIIVVIAIMLTCFVVVVVVVFISKLSLPALGKARSSVHPVQ